MIMLNKIRKRVFGRSGFMLSETLVAILIMLIVTSIVVTGIPVAANVYRKVVDASNAELLLSTTMARLRSELATASGVGCKTTDKVGDETPTIITYTNARGSKSMILLGDTDNEPGIYIQEYADRENTGNPENVSENFSPKRLLVSKEASNKNLYATYSEANYENGVITISDLTVKKENDTLTSIEKFEIRVMSADLQN